MVSHQVWPCSDNDNMTPMMWAHRPALSVSCRPHSNNDADDVGTWPMASHWVWLRSNNNNMTPMMWVPASSASCWPCSNSDATMPTTWAHVATPQRQQHDANHMGPHPLTPLGAKSEAVILSTHGPEPIPASPLQDHVSVSRDLGLLDLKVGA